MIKQYKGFKAKICSGFEELPTGGYVCKIMDALVVENPNGGERLEVSIDIAEGEHKGYYREQYRNDTRDEKKWSGVFTLFIPVEDGSEKDSWSIKTFNNFIGCLENDNPSYHYDSDESKMKNLTLALVFRKEEYKKNDGDYAWKVKPFKAITVEDCRNGKWGKYDDKPVKNKPAESASFTSAFSSVDDDSGLPF